MPYWFCSEFYTLSSSAKIFENRLRFDKVTESLKVGPFCDTVYIKHTLYTLWSIKKLGSNSGLS